VGKSLFSKPPIVSLTKCGNAKENGKRINNATQPAASHFQCGVARFIKRFTFDFSLV
jgi:hypothetical protein